MMRTPPRRRFALTGMLAVLALALAPLAAQAVTGNGKLQIHHIKVGQGDGMILISPNGQTAMFDDGVYTNCPPVVAYLQGLGITSLDYHFLSHYHADHLGCLDDAVAAGIPVNIAGYDRGYSYSSASYTNYVNALGAKRTTIAKGQTITLDAGSANPVTIKCVDLNGAGVYSVSGSDENAKSAVYKVSYGAFDQVIGGDLTGDGSTDVETTVGPMVGDVEIYKVHHHGSRYSTNDNWLGAITAEVGIIQVGDGNTYGHPTVDALTRLHNHNVKTYWTETGAGAAPNATWDKVANGPILVQVDLAAGNYTITGNGINDTYTLGGGGGGPVVLTDTKVATVATMLNGTVTSGSVANLAASDNSRMTVTAKKTGTPYWTEWYGEAVLAHPPISLTVKYEGNYSVSRTQTLHLWNWSTNAWVQVDQATVGTTDVTRQWTTTTPGAYVSPAGVVRCRVLASNRSSSYTCRADHMAFTYEYYQGTGITLSPERYAALVPADLHEPRKNPAPQAMVQRLSAVAAADGATLEWSTHIKEHVDGFNVYREDANGERVFLGHEALLATTSDEAVFTYTDREAPEGTSRYWLGARSCAGPEGLVGPIELTRLAAAGTPMTLALAVSPNPAASKVRFALRLPEAGAVELAIYDLTGRRVATPLRGAAFAGETSLEWNLDAETGGRVSPGMYFAKLNALGRTTVTRITVLP